MCTSLQQLQEGTCSGLETYRQTTFKTGRSQTVSGLGHHIFRQVGSNVSERPYRLHLSYDADAKYIWQQPVSLAAETYHRHARQMPQKVTAVQLT
jgi:hypothetical protein